MIRLIKSLVLWLIKTYFRTAWFAVKLLISLLFRLPMLSYMAWVSITSLAILVALSPAIVHDYRNAIRKAALVNTVLLSVVSEMPHWLILAKLVLIGLTKVFGIYRSPLSWPFLLLDIVSLAGCLGLLYQQAEDVQVMVDQAEPFLGKDRTRFEPFSLLVEVFAPLWRDDNLICYKETGYFGAEQLRENSVKRLVLQDIGTMDIYTSEGTLPGANKPVIINVHGGSWSQGSNKVPNTVLSVLAHSGDFLVMNINFRLAPKFPLPAAIVDVKRAIIFAKRTAKAYGGDPSNVIVMGDSSGGHCALVTALTANLEAFQQETPEADTRVQGAVLICPALDPLNNNGLDHRSGEDKWFIRQCCGGDADVANLVHPTQYASKDMPPVLSLHGSVDTLVDFKNSQRFKEVCAKQGAGEKFDLVELPHAHHAHFLFRSMRTVAEGHIAADWIRTRFGNAKKEN